MDKSLYPVLMCVCIAAAYIAVLFFRDKKYQTNISLIRSAIERGQPLDAEVVNKLIQPQQVPTNNPYRSVLVLRVAAILMLATGIGFPILGYFLSSIDSEAFPALQGVGGLLVCLSIGLFVASKLVHSTIKADQST